MTVHSMAAPRALRSSVRASGDPANMLRQLHAAFDEFKASQNSKFDGAQAAIDALNVRLAAIGIGGSVTASGVVAEDPEYSGIYASWLRDGDVEASQGLHKANAAGFRKEVLASMSAGSSSGGGYLAPVEWDRMLNQVLVAKSPMRRLATVLETKVRGYSSLWSKDGWGSGWVGETAARTMTSTPTLDPVEYVAGEIYANPAITQQLLDDADYPLEQWISSELGEEFAKQESVAFLSGDGANKPRGLLTYIPGGASETVHPGGTLTIVPSGSATAIGSSDKLIDFVYSLSSPYRQGANWLMNSMTAAEISKMKDGDGNYLWRETYVAGQPATLLGYPVEIDENMPSVAAGNLPIAFGDFRSGYAINDRAGIRVLRDPYTNKPYVHFYTTKRVGGGVRDPRAIRLLKIGAS